MVIRFCKCANSDFSFNLKSSWSLVYNQLKACWRLVEVLCTTCWRLVEGLSKSCVQLVEGQLKACWSPVEVQSTPCWKPKIFVLKLIQKRAKVERIFPRGYKMFFPGFYNLWWKGASYKRKLTFSVSQTIGLYDEKNMVPLVKHVSPNAYCRHSWGIISRIPVNECSTTLMKLILLGWNCFTISSSIWGSGKLCK